MAKNFQLTHILATSKPSTTVYAAICGSNKEPCAIKITDLEAVTDSKLILVGYLSLFYPSIPRYRKTGGIFFCFEGVNLLNSLEPTLTYR